MSMYFIMWYLTESFHILYGIKFSVSLSIVFFELYEFYLFYE